MDKTWTEKKLHARKVGMRGRTFSLASRLRWCSIPCRCWWSRWRWYIWCFMPEHRWLSWSWGPLLPVSSAQSFGIFWFQACVWRETWIMMKSSRPPQKTANLNWMQIPGKEWESGNKSIFFKTRLQKRCCSLAPKKKFHWKDWALKKAMLIDQWFFWARPHASEHVPVDQEKWPRYTTLAQTVPDKLIYTTIPWWH